MFYSLPDDLIRYIYSFDNTYKQLYDNVINTMNMKFMYKNKIEDRIQSILLLKQQLTIHYYQQFYNTIFKHVIKEINLDNDETLYNKYNIFGSLFISLNNISYIE